MEDIYRDGIATIKLHEKSNKIPIKKGVRQGDIISLKLFKECLKEVFKNLEWEDIGVKNDGEHLNNLRFANDIVLLSESEDKESRKVGLKMNMKKKKTHTK